jgi:lysyl-tRNA synthetase class 2
MKRLLCAGFPDIFSICRVFRDGESGLRHQPEFTMIEWYRRGLGLESIIDDTLKMILAALTPAVLSDDVIQFQYRDCFVGNANVDPLTATVEELADAAGVDKELRQAIGEERDDWLDLILTTRVAPSFEPHRLTVLRHYPASQAALARLCPNDSRVADRFEVFIGTVELANGYVELVDAKEQSARIGRDNEERRRRGRRVRPHDSRLLAALESGLPACAGVAVGFERLQMIYANTEDMRDVIPFSFETAP